MIRNVLVVVAVASASLNAYATEEKPLPDAVVVRVLGTKLPAEENEKEKFLWDVCANKPEVQEFNSLTAERWKDNFKAFAAALVKKAGELKLDAASLQKALGLVLKDSRNRIAYLPVGAYQTTLEGRLVWIITVKWEYPSMDEVAPGVGLCHIRAFVFDQKHVKRVGYVTCM